MRLTTSADLACLFIDHTTSTREAHGDVPEPQGMGSAAFTTSPLNHVTQLSEVGVKNMETRPEEVQGFMRPASPSFLQQRHNPFLKPGILAAHDCF
jgi:hypothetical protein